jgi:hypothetical protein
LRRISDSQNIEQDNRRAAGMSHLNITKNLTLADFSIAGGFTNEGASALVSDTLQSLSSMSGGGILPDFNTVQSSFFGNTTFTINAQSNSFTIPAFTPFTPAFPAFTNANAQSNFATPNFALASNAALALNAQSNSIPAFPGFVNGRAP